MDAKKLMDPEILVMLDAMPPVAPLTAESLPETRAMVDRIAADYRPTGAVESCDHVLHSADGREFVVRVYRSKGSDVPIPALLWIHGGGLVSGSHRNNDASFDHWCPALGVTGISVDYGLAPEVPYPGPVEDCYAALAWIHENAEDLGISAGRVGIGGSSAGGNLAAALALLARDRGEYSIDYQALVCPMLDDRMVTASSSWDVPIWAHQSNDFGWNAYLDGRRGQPDVPFYAAPSRAEDLRRLPATFVSVGALDIFLDESVDYASRLMHSGVSVELHVYPGAPHGFDGVMAGTTIARRSRANLDAWLAARIGDH